MTNEPYEKVRRYGARCLTAALFLTTVLAVAAGFSASAAAQSGCITNGLVQVASGNVLLLDVTASPAEYIQLGSVPSYNATGYNVADGLIYGIDRTGPGPLWNVVSFDPASGTSAVAATTPVRAFWGDVDDSGQLYHGDGGPVMGITDLAAGTTSTVVLPASSGVADIGFVPSDQLFYGVRNGGTSLWVYDPATNMSSLIALSGPIIAESGAFGAVWTVDGGASFYAFNNASGNIFGIDLTTGVSVFQTASTPNGSNDGMACFDQANPFTDPPADYGDAPDSYGTLIASGGAGGLDYAGISLGAGATIDADGQPSALADADLEDDGVTIGASSLQAAPLPIGETVTIDISSATDAGFVSAWIDWDANGVFDVAEQVAVDVSPSGGAVAVTASVPATAPVGPSFARFRIAGRVGSGPTGLFSYGEVEDYLVLFDNRPVADDDGPIPATEEAPVTFDVIGNDSDIDGPLDPADVSLVAGPANGTAVYNGDGTFTYTGDPGFVGTDTFTYEICDPEGLCDTAVVTVTVVDEGSPAAAPDGPIAVPQDSTVPVTIDVIANDTATDDATVTSVDPTSTNGGTVTLNMDGSVDYLPPPGFVGTDTFTYELCDDDSPAPTCSTATVTIDVQPLADLSIAVTDPGPITPGDPAVVPITVANAGPGDAPGTTVVYSPPAGVTVDTANLPVGCTADTPSLGAVTCDVGTVSAGGSTNIDIPVIVDPDAPANTALAGGTVDVSSGAGDPDLTNNSQPADVTTGSAGADLALSVVDEPNLQPGQSGEVVLSVTNLGPSTSGSFDVIFTLPPGVVFDANHPNPDGCVVSGTVVTCSLPGPIEPGTSLDVVIPVMGLLDQPSSLPPPPTSAEIVNQGVTDPDASNDSTDVVIGLDLSGDSDGDGIPDEIEIDPGMTGVPADTDGDGVPDYLDTDSDGDGIADSVEVGPNPEAPIDSDGDGIPDYLDTDPVDDALPVTGSETGAMALVGLALVATGLAMVLANRIRDVSVRASGAGPGVVDGWLTRWTAALLTTPLTVFWAGANRLASPDTGRAELLGRPRYFPTIRVRRRTPSGRGRAARGPAG